VAQDGRARKAIEAQPSFGQIKPWRGHVSRRAEQQPREKRDVEGPAQEVRDFKPRQYLEASGALQEIHMCESLRQSFWHVRS
jgi:hypothetical protein